LVSDQERYAGTVTKASRELEKDHGQVPGVKEVAAKIQESQALMQDEEMRAMAREELQSLEQRREALLAELCARCSSPKDRTTRRTSSSRSGRTGGEEASLFASELFRMYSRYASGAAGRIDVLTSKPERPGGVKEVIALITAKQVYSRLKHESGVHRVQRSGHRVVGAHPHVDRHRGGPPEARRADRNQREGSAGRYLLRHRAGGQGVNTTYSAIRLTHLPTGMVVQCQDERSQHKEQGARHEGARLPLLDLEPPEAARCHRPGPPAARSARASAPRKSGPTTSRMNRLTDHRASTVTIHRLPEIMEGDIDPIIEPVLAHTRPRP